MDRLSSIAERVAAEDSYGVFVWSEDGRYPAKNAVKVFKSKVLAQRFADKNIDKNYVVRTIWNPAAHGEDRQMTHWNASIAERIAASRWVKFDDLPAVTRDDIAAEIEERFNVYRPVDDLKGLVNPPIFLVRDVQIRSITGYNRQPSKLAVDKYVKMLESGSEAPPILVDGNKFVDGGHRFAAYVKAGRKTIPAVDVGRLFKLWPEWIAGRAFELERVVSDR